ncbi:hypothetical protein P5673_000941 [Acropora cervicornis]|uniref:Uncharacterized protein n=1 Tax=Acropora cervicornis TaxID=6130 RepID=A0AAD9R595_ACRCE|nr:hypothetical protein P5673_000941 [Acropora cervicornis]
MSRIDSDVSSPVVLDRHCRYPTGIGKTKAGWVNSRVLFDWCNVNIQCPFEQYTEVQTAHAREHLALSLQQKLDTWPGLGHNNSQDFIKRDSMLENSRDMINTGSVGKASLVWIPGIRRKGFNLGHYENWEIWQIFSTYFKYLNR